MHCAIWYHLYNFKKVQNTHAILLKATHLHWVFFTFFKLYKWYQIAQNITYKETLLNVDYKFRQNYTLKEA